VLDAGSFDAPSTKAAVELLGSWGKDHPVLIVALPDEESLIKSFRNLDRVAITVPGELEVAQVVWARSLLVSEGALELINGRAS
jgi:ribosomal protein L4